MEAMDGGAFGSLVAAANVAISGIASVGERIIRGSRIRLFQDPTESTHRSIEVREISTMELLGSEGNVVGTGVIDGNIKCGMELNVVKLCPSEMAVQVVEVSDGSVWTGKIVGERLGQCIGLVIRWKRALLRTVEGRWVSVGESNEGQNFSFPALVVPEFEFEKGDTSITYDNAPPLPKGSFSSAGNTSPLTEGSHSNTGILPIVDGLPTDRQSRRYSMQNRCRRAMTPREKGEPLGEKVKPDSVVAAKTKRGCKCNCLRDVDEKYILDQRYMAWGQKYEQQTTSNMDSADVERILFAHEGEKEGQI
jgi:hypothetical protein